MHNAFENSIVILTQREKHNDYCMLQIYCHFWVDNASS